MFQCEIIINELIHVPWIKFFMYTLHIYYISIWKAPISSVRLLHVADGPVWTRELEPHCPPAMVLSKNPSVPVSPSFKEW